MIDRTHRLSVTRQARLLGLSWASVYYTARPTKVGSSARTGSLQRRCCGAREDSDHAALSHSGLLETVAVLDARNTIIARVEVVLKSADDLVLEPPQFSFSSARSFNFGAMSLGFVREIAPLTMPTLGIGAMATVNVVPQFL